MRREEAIDGKQEMCETAKRYKANRLREGWKKYLRTQLEKGDPMFKSVRVRVESE